MGTIRHIRLNKTLTSFSFSPNLPSKTIKVIQTQINIINGPLLPTQPYYIMTAITNTVFQKHGKPLFFTIFSRIGLLLNPLSFLPDSSPIIAQSCPSLDPQSVTQSVMPLAIFQKHNILVNGDNKKDNDYKERSLLLLIICSRTLCTLHLMARVQ